MRGCCRRQQAWADVLQTARKGTLRGARDMGRCNVLKEWLAALDDFRNWLRLGL
jgi:hypothetical protein